MNDYDFDDAGLGADEYGNVTYYGQVILPADQVQNRNNITYVSDPSVLQKAASAYNAKGDVGVRADAENYGMSGNKFGYDDKGNVLYDGMIFLTADQVKDLGRIEGNTVFLNEADMMDAVLDYKKNTGNEIVPVRSYVQSTGSPVTVQWQNGMVNVNGEMIKPEFVKDGRRSASASPMKNRLRLRRAAFVLLLCRRSNPLFFSFGGKLKFFLRT